MLMVHIVGRPFKILQGRYRPSWWHAGGSASPSATSPSRWGSALRSSWRMALICSPWPASVEGGSWVGFMLLLDGIRVGDKAIFPKKYCDKTFMSLPTPTQNKIWQHMGHVFGKMFKNNNSINRHKKLVCGKPRHRKSFVTSQSWARTKWKLISWLRKLGGWTSLEVKEHLSENKRTTEKSKTN